jgi:hypothetical protein
MPVLVDALALEGVGAALFGVLGGGQVQPLLRVGCCGGMAVGVGPRGVAVGGGPVAVGGRGARLGFGGAGGVLGGGELGGIDRQCLARCPVGAGQPGQVRAGLGEEPGEAVSGSAAPHLWPDPGLDRAQP